MTSTDIQTGALKPALHRPMMAVLLFVIVGGLLAPIWTVRYPPILDYPNHLANAFVLAHLKDSAYHFGQFYRADWNTYPYLTMDTILLGWQQIISIGLAGRVLLSLCVLSVPAATWFFIRRANPGEESLALWSLLVSNNIYFFLYGFVNLQLSLSLCLLVLGLWLDYLERHRWALWWLLLFLSTALYFTHLMGFAIAAVVMTCYVLCARRRLRELLSTWLLFVPGIVFYAYAMWGLGPRGALQFRTVTNKAVGLAAVMAGCSPAIDFFTLLAMAACLAWVVAGNRGCKWNPGWWGTVGALFLLYWLLPGAYGPATNVDKRLLPFIFVIALAGVKVGPKGKSLATVAVILFLIRTAALERHFRSIQPHLTELSQSFSVIPEGTRVLPLVDWAEGSPLPERHFWAYGVIERGWVSPCLFHDPGVHLFALRLQSHDPCGQAITPSSHLDWERVQTGFDYVWAYRVPQFSPALSSMGKVVFVDDDLKIFRMGH
jgi:hypothetical protein